MRWTGILPIIFMMLVSNVAKPQANSVNTNTAPISSRFPAAWYPDDDSNTYTEAPVTGAPYSAAMVTSYAPPYFDPSSQRTQRNAWYRDSMGRTRQEQGRSGSYTSSDGVMHYSPLIREIEVNDPVNHCQFHWIEQPEIADPNPSARVNCISRIVQYSAADPNAYIMKQEAGEDPGDSTFLHVHYDPLGKREIEGFVAFGMRRLVTHPHDSPPTTKVLEVWYSPQLHELIRFGPVSPSPGELTFEMKDIHLGEPDSNLFYPPANYRIVQERTYVRP